MSHPLNIINLLESGSSSEITEMLQDLNINELDEETIKALCGLLVHSDKGVQNAVSFFLGYNHDGRTADYLTRYISSDDITIRNLAGDTLLKLQDKATPGLIRFLSSSNDNDDIKFAVDLLGLIGDVRANEKIIHILPESENENVIIACIEALGNLKCEEAIDYLIMCFDKNDLFKANVIEAIGKIGSRQSLEFLNKKYLTEDDFTKFSIIESMGLIGDEETFFFLLAEINQTEGPLVWPLIGSIYNLKEKFGFDIPFDEKMKNAVVQTIFAADPRYKKVAGYLVNIFEDREINNACLKIYGDDAELDEIIKSKFMEYKKDKLSDITSIINEKPSNLLQLLLLLQETLDSYRYSEVVISSVEQRDIINSITICLEDPDEEVRKAAMNILFNIDPNTALLFLDVMIEDDNVWNRLNLLDLLYGIHDQKVYEAAVILSRDKNEMVAERAEFLKEENKQFVTYTEET